MERKKKQPSPENSLLPDLASVSRVQEAADASISRRGFLGFAAASIFLAHADQQVPRLESRNGIPYRTLGRPREKISLIGLRGYHLGQQADPPETIPLLPPA